jgi:hypothetical protein
MQNPLIFLDSNALTKFTILRAPKNLKLTNLFNNLRIKWAKLKEVDF